MGLVNFLRAWPAVVLISLLVAYTIAAYFVPAIVLIELGDAFAIPMAFAAFLVYGRTLWHSLRNRNNPDYIDFLVFGISGLALVNSVDRTLRLGSRLGYFDLLTSPVLGGLLTALTFFAALHILVRGDPHMARKPAATWAWNGKRVVLCALAWGVVFSALIVGRRYFA